MNEEEETARQDGAGRALETTAKILSLLYALISVLWLMWILIPEHQRRLLAMRAAKTAERNAWRTAFRAGHQEMGLELKGCATSYQVPYRLSRLAMSAERAYEKLRYSS
jgi:hypothetical protein